MADSGLSGRHFPYLRPSAHTSAFLGSGPETAGGTWAC
ncbi:hypothetical protein BJY54_001184 [Streptomyces nodosus]|nr:hypothetical protein [Streptomyces nodosus]